jgi:hypothetical protein
VAFFKLGNMTAPESFFRFTEDKNSVVITLTEPADIDSVMYYTGLWTGFYTLEFSSDGSNWVEQNPAEGKDHSMNQPHSDLFKWVKRTSMTVTCRPNISAYQQQKHHWSLAKSQFTSKETA